MNNDIMIDVVKKVFSTYQPGDMGLDLRDVIAAQEEIIKMLEANKWHYDDVVGCWDSSDYDVVCWKPIYYGDVDEKEIVKFD